MRQIPCVPFPREAKPPRIGGIAIRITIEHPELVRSGLIQSDIQIHFHLAIAGASSVISLIKNGESGRGIDFPQSTG